MTLEKRAKHKPLRTAGPATYTPHFKYQRAESAPRQSQELHCERVPLSQIAGRVGTPAYVYSQASIEEAYRRLDRAFSSIPHLVCYAVKANSNLSVLRLMAGLGSGFDIVSGGELDRLRRIGISGDRIVLSGVGKSRDEIRDALNYRSRGSGPGILLFNIESSAELECLLGEASRVAARRTGRPSVSVRVNPNVLAGGHRHISTGHHHHKFGIDWNDARRLYLEHKDSRWIAWRGISAHIGSQIVSLAPFRSALERVASFFRDLRENGVRLDLLDFGGGLGIRYTNENPPRPQEYARTITKIVGPLGCRLLLEPGRTLVGPAGVLLMRVLYVKETRGKLFVIVDAGMNDFIRPVLYEASHPITPVSRNIADDKRKKPVDIVGPVCESGDFLARDRALEQVRSGDLLAMWATGAYGFVESSNFNSRRRPAEVLVQGVNYAVVRRRESYADLVRGEA